MERNKKMNRQEMIYELTKFELQYFYDNNDDTYLEQLSEFFSKGGFTNWSDEDILDKYKKDILAED